MATTLEYAIGDLYSGPRLRIIDEYSSDLRIAGLIEWGAQQRDARSGALSLIEEEEDGPSDWLGDGLLGWPIGSIQEDDAGGD